MAKQWNPFTLPLPIGECLTHEAVLVQAWKKSYAYIRTRNWYADVLQLDLSAANLRAEIEQWHNACLETGAVPKPQPMRLVPAPKPWMWEFAKDDRGVVRWQPKTKNPKTGEEEIPVLRPLAHLSIRDQTFATAAMVCLANLIETAQGNCALPTTDATKQGVSSYGNRLYCEWAKPRGPKDGCQARFGWGNANTYRKYYADHRAFLQRPREICTETEPLLEHGEKLGVVSMDLAGFYDCIQPARLVLQR